MVCLNDLRHDKVCPLYCIWVIALQSKYLLRNKQSLIQHICFAYHIEQNERNIECLSTLSNRDLHEAIWGISYWWSQQGLQATQIALWSQAIRMTMEQEVALCAYGIGVQAYWIWSIPMGRSASLFPSTLMISPLHQNPLLPLTSMFNFFLNTSNVAILVQLLELLLELITSR